MNSTNAVKKNLRRIMVGLAVTWILQGCSLSNSGTLAQQQEVITVNSENEIRSELEKRMQWWEDARFGLFIHWGPYSVLGGEYKGENLAGKYAEQIQRICKIEAEDYLKHAASQFKPDDFNAEDWVKLAVDAGMKYVVITAKHHDGFGIYHSKHSEFDIEDAAGFKRDPLKELSDACQRHGLKFGVYYSQSQDWHDVFQGTWQTPGNPAANRGSVWSNPDKTKLATSNKEMFDRYMKEKAIPQVEELVRDYGVELLWFDTPGAYLAEYAHPLMDAARKINPDVLINNRVGFGHGDYVGGADSPVVFPPRENRYWEAIQSTLHSWGYNKYDEMSRRPTDYLIRMLATVVSRGGTMMINVGPMPDGRLVVNDVKSLQEIAAWSKDHIMSIRGAGKSPLPIQNWGVVTSKGKKLYLHVFDWPQNGTLRLGGLHSSVSSAKLMANGEPLPFNRLDEGVLELSLPSLPTSAFNSVIELDFAQKPLGDEYRLLEPNVLNRFHTADTPYLYGDIKPSNGTGIRAFINNWTSPEAKITWKVRVAEKGDYQLQCLYDLPHGIAPGDRYEISMGDQSFVETVDGQGDGDPKLIKAEKQLMRLKKGQASMTNALGQSIKSGKNPTQGMIVDDLGVISLEAGVYDLSLKSSGAVRGNLCEKELFYPRAVFLMPRT